MLTESGERLLARAAFAPTWPDEYHPLISHMAQLAANSYPGSQLRVFGSAASGFWDARSSDVDLTLVAPELQGRDATLAALEQLSSLFILAGLHCTRQVPGALVPIIVLEGDGQHINITIDISINNELAVLNSDLLHRYRLYDLRVYPLVMLIKSWAKLNGRACTVQY